MSVHTNPATLVVRGSITKGTRRFTRESVYVLAALYVTLRGYKDAVCVLCRPERKSSLTWVHHSSLRYVQGRSVIGSNVAHIQNVLERTNLLVFEQL